jgi:hypothetical protein
MRNLINLIESIVTEATLSKYGPGKMLMISDSQAGQPLIDALRQQGVDPTGPMELLDANKALANPKKVAGTVGKNKPGVVVYAFKNNKGQIWASYGNPAMVHYHGPSTDKPDEVGKISNRGDVAEGILGAAMFAKFTKREGGTDIGTVTVQDVVRVLGTLKPVGNDYYQVQVKDADNRHADTITLSVQLKTVPYQDLLDPAKRHLLAKEFSSAIGYVNSAMAERYSRFFYLNGKADEIAVVADGKAGEGEAKPDVWVIVKDPQGNPRKLKLNVSLKTKGIGQFAQVGGTSVSSMRELWAYFGINVDEQEFIKQYENDSKQDQQKALAFLYGKIAEVLAAKLEGDDINAEVRFVDQLSKAITYFATMDEKGVELVDFDAGGFKILRFNKLRQQLRNTNLTASFIAPRTADGKPEIAVHEVGNPKNVLVAVRAKIENKISQRTGEKYIYWRNIIEKGPLLEKITTVQQKSWKELEHPNPKDIAAQLGASAPRARRTAPESPRQRRK